MTSSISENETILRVSFSFFFKYYAVEHITMPPYNPGSNGQAERFVDNVQKGVKLIELGREGCSSCFKNL